MNELANIESNNLPAMVSRAASMLANAKGAAEVLEARDVASFAYDAAKKAARLSKAKHAHDELIVAAHRAQADALEIESQAHRRLADEYDAAQERGEVGQRTGRPKDVPDQNDIPTASDVGLTRKQIFDARTIRDAEVNDPGIVRRVLDERLEKGEEPTKAALREAVIEAAQRGGRGHSPKGRNPHYVAPTAGKAAWLHIAGQSRALVEWATPENLNLAHEGCRAGSGSRIHDLDIQAVRDCSQVLLTFLENVDAE